MSTPLDTFADELRASFTRHADGCQRMAAALPEGEERRGYALQAATFQQAAHMVEAQRSEWRPTETPASTDGDAR